MLELVQEERQLSVVEVEERLEHLRELNAKLDAAKTKCDQLKLHYMQKIQRAQDIFEQETEDLCAEIDSVTATLRQYAEANITGKCKSLKFPSGTLSLTKQQPNFFIDGTPVANDNPKLIELARRLDADLIATKEVAKWGEFKKRLVVDGTTVYLKDTGEVVPELRARTEPDDFKIKTA